MALGLWIAIVVLVLSCLLCGWLLWSRFERHARTTKLRQSLQDASEALNELKARREEEVAARHHTEDKLRGYLQLLDTLINTIPNPIYFKDADGIFRGCNRAFSNTILGLPRNQIIGRRNQDLTEQIPADLAAYIQKQENSLKDRRGIHGFETEVPCADGRRREFHFSIAAVTDGSDETAGSVGVMLDLTEKNRAARDRNQKDKFQGVLETAGAVCHEMNQPLQALSGYSELMQLEVQPDDPLFELAEQVVSQVERLADITGKLQNLTRYETVSYGNQARIIDIHRSSQSEAQESTSAKTSETSAPPSKR